MDMRHVEGSVCCSNSSLRNFEKENIYNVTELYSVRMNESYLYRED